MEKKKTSAMSVRVYTVIKVAWERNDTKHPTQHRLCRT